MSRCLTICENIKMAKLPLNEIIEISDSDDDCSIHMQDSNVDCNLTTDKVIELSESDSEVTSSLANTENSNSNDREGGFSQSSPSGQSVNSEAVFSLQCLHMPTPTVPERVERRGLEYSETQVAVKTEPVEESSVLDHNEVPKKNQSVQENSIRNSELVLLVPDYIIPNNISTEAYTNRFPSASCTSGQFYSCHFGGKHNFMIGLSCPQVVKRTESLMYCQEQNKLYVTKDQPFKITVKADNVPSGTFLTAFAMYSQPEHSKTLPVRRCPTHERLDFDNGVVWYEHLVVSLSDVAIYKEENKVLSVSVPYEHPQNGEECTYYLFKLTCFNSCTGGINRRPYSLVFSLENDGKILGRQTVNTKVCACPYRDYNLDVQRKLKTNAITDSPSLNFNGYSFKNVEKPECGQYSIKVKDYELYKFLNDLKSLYEAGAHVQHIKKKNTQEFMCP